MTGWKNKRTMMQRYDATAEGYEELHAQEQQAKYAAALREVDVSGGLVLDVGCGSGLFFREIASKAKLVVGVDISRKLLLKAKLRAEVFGEVFVVQADADHLPFEKGAFDYIFAFTMLQNMPEPKETMLELGKVVKQEGKVLVTALKKAFSPPTFMDLVETGGLTAVSFVDEEALKCYVVLAAKRFASAT